MRLGQKLAAARRANVTGTARVLDVARALHVRAPVRRFVHVSTAFVAGTHGGRFSERDAWVGQRFRNAYEQSHLEAETLTRDAHELPTAGTLDIVPVDYVAEAILALADAPAGAATYHLTGGAIATSLHQLGDLVAGHLDRTVAPRAVSGPCATTLHRSPAGRLLMAHFRVGHRVKTNVGCKKSWPRGAQ